MSHRPLAIVSGLTIGDYLLWNWSLNGSHDVLALVSGLTLPPLAVAFVWLVALTGARMLARGTRRSTRGAGAAAGRAERTDTWALSTAKASARLGARRRIAKRYDRLNELRAANGARAGRTAQRAPAATAPRQASAPPSTSATATAQSSPSPDTRSSRKIAA